MTYLRKSVPLVMAALLFSTPSLTVASPAMAMGGQPKACCMQMAHPCGSQLRGAKCCAWAPGVALQQTPNYSPTQPDNLGLLAPHSAVRGVEGSPVFCVDISGGSNSPPGSSSILRI